MSQSTTARFDRRRIQKLTMKSKLTVSADQIYILLLHLAAKNSTPYTERVRHIADRAKPRDRNILPSEATATGNMVFCGSQCGLERNDSAERSAIYNEVEEDAFSDDDSTSATPLLATHEASKYQNFYLQNPHEAKFCNHAIPDTFLVYDNGRRQVHNSGSAYAGRCQVSSDDSAEGKPPWESKTKHACEPANYLYHGVENTSPILDRGCRQMNSNDSDYVGHVEVSPKDRNQAKMHQTSKSNLDLELENASLRRDLRHLGDMKRCLEETTNAHLKELESLLLEEPARNDDVCAINDMAGEMEVDNEHHGATDKKLNTKLRRLIDETKMALHHHREAVQRLDEENATLKAENKHVRMMNDQLNNNLCHSTEERIAADLRHAEAIERFKNDIAFLKAEIQHACEEKDELNIKICRANEKASAASRCHEELVRDLKENTTNLKADNQRMRVVNENLNTRLRHINEESNAALLHHRETIKRLQDENASLKAGNHSAWRANEDRNTILLHQQETIQHLQTEISSLRQQLRTLHHQLPALTAVTLRNRVHEQYPAEESGPRCYYRSSPVPVMTNIQVQQNAQDLLDDVVVTDLLMSMRMEFGSRVWE